jgi:hypothetical protein
MQYASSNVGKAISGNADCQEMGGTDFLVDLRQWEFDVTNSVLHSRFCIYIRYDLQQFNRTG